MDRPTRLRLSAFVVLIPLAACVAPAFDYARHDPPRVWIEHRPIHPVPGDEITLTADPETAAGTAVRTLQISYTDAVGARTIPACAPAEDPCVRRVPAAAAAGERLGFGSYRARMTTTAGERVATPLYLFQIGSDEEIVPGAPAGRAIPIRVPWDLAEQPRAFKVLLVADEPTYGRSARALSDDGFQHDIERVVYDQLLRDPAYRWRDDQLAWFAFTRTGVTTSARSGSQSRCGQRPWPGLDLLPDFVRRYAAIDLIGVLHRRSDPLFRDCAGLAPAAGVPGGKTGFSADVSRPAIFQHEFGHGLFGLSDEYWEPEDERRVTGEVLRLTECRYCTDMLTTDCVPSPLGEDLPLLSPDCFAAPPDCPSLRGDCRRPNIFPREDECHAAAERAALHPGVEAPADPEDCRPLCRGNCPCDPPATEYFVLDRRVPAAGPGEADDDVMGAFAGMTAGERHGPACALCIELSFCMRWETGRGRSEDEAWRDCSSR